MTDSRPFLVFDGLLLMRLPARVSAEWDFLCLPLPQAVARRSSRYRNATPAAGKLEEPDRWIELDRLKFAGEG
jgi:hypothetical protein